MLSGVKKHNILLHRTKWHFPQYQLLSAYRAAAFLSSSIARNLSIFPLCLAETRFSVRIGDFIFDCFVFLGASLTMLAPVLSHYCLHFFHLFHLTFATSGSWEAILLWRSHSNQSSQSWMPMPKLAALIVCANSTQSQSNARYTPPKHITAKRTLANWKRQRLSFAVFGSHAKHLRQRNTHRLNRYRWHLLSLLRNTGLNSADLYMSISMLLLKSTAFAVESTFSN